MGVAYNPYQRWGHRHRYNRADCSIFRAYARIIERNKERKKKLWLRPFALERRDVTPGIFSTRVPVPKLCFDPALDATTDHVSDPPHCTSV